MSLCYEIVEESEVAVIKEEQEVEGLAQSIDELSLTSTGE